MFDLITDIQNVAKKIVGGNFKCIGDQYQTLQRGDLFTPLDHSDIVGAQIRTITQILLTKPSFFPILADVLSYGFVLH